MSRCLKTLTLIEARTRIQLEPNVNAALAAKS
jgi:hypothetical protein